MARPFWPPSRLLVVDLTGELICGELIGTPRSGGRGTGRTWLLPSELSTRGCSPGSPPPSLLMLGRSRNAGREPGGARAERAVDTRVLEQLHGALGGDVTPPRLAAAVRAALGHTSTPLTPAEQGLIAAELFPPNYRRQIEPNLVKIEAFLADLATPCCGPGTRLRPRPPAYFACLALEPAARSARGEVLAALAIQWLTVQVTGGTQPGPAVIVCGADEISRPHLERLASACERRRVPLTLLFRHLRDSGLAMLGGGATAFMRLGNHVEAQQAADYIGRSTRSCCPSSPPTSAAARPAPLPRPKARPSPTPSMSAGAPAGPRAGSCSGPGSGGVPRVVAGTLPGPHGIPDLVHRVVPG